MVDFVPKSLAAALRSVQESVQRKGSEDARTTITWATGRGFLSCFFWCVVPKDTGAGPSPSNSDTKSLLSDVDESTTTFEAANGRALDAFSVLIGRFSDAATANGLPKKLTFKNRLLPILER